MINLLNFLRRKTEEKTEEEEESKQISLNLVSIIAFGLLVCLIYLFFWKTLLDNNPLRSYSYIGIIIAIFLAGAEIVPIEHAEAIKILGFVSEKFYFKMGLRWRIWPLMNVERRDVKIHMTDPPFLKAVTNDKPEIPMEVDIQIFWRNCNIAKRLKIEKTPGREDFDHEKEMIDNALISRSQEAILTFVGKRSMEKCLTSMKEIQEEIKLSITRQIGEWGIKVTSIDVKSILPSADILAELSENKGRQIRTEELREAVKKIKEASPGLSDKQVTELALVTQKIATLEIREHKNSYKLDSTKEVLDAIAGALKMFKGDNNG